MRNRLAVLFLVAASTACANSTSAPVSVGSPTPTSSTPTPTPVPTATTPVETPTPEVSPTPTPAPVAADWKLRGAIVTTAGVIDPGEITVLGDTITCVATICDTTSPVPTWDAGGFVFPGLVDMHNHVAYDFLPPWTPPAVYDNRGQWQSTQAYKDAKLPYTTYSSTYSCEMTKYAEVSALAAGVTTTEGAPQKPCVDTLVRDIDNYNGLGVDRIRTNVIGISTVSTSDAVTINAQMDAGTTQSYLIHLAEGVDETSRAEWDKLAARNLVRKETVIIHGTALGHAEFAQMGAKGMSLIWSPVSNVVLYGLTTDVITAKADGVKISLAPDWTLSGSASMLDELHFATQISDDYGGIFTDRELVDMVTKNPADAASYGDLIGRLKPGAKADLLVLKGWDGADPYSALVRGATRQDIALVTVAGRGLYGTPALMQPFADALSETVTVCGEDRVLSLAKTSTTNLQNQTWFDVTDRIWNTVDPSAIDPLYVNPSLCY